MLLCGYSPFRSDDMKELVRQTTEAKITFHDRYWNNVSEEGKKESPLCATHKKVSPPLAAAKGFIRALLDPDPARRLSAEQALAHTWLTTYAPTTEHDLSGLRENFDPRARWRHAIGAARIISRLKNKTPSLSDDDDDDDDEGSWYKAESSHPTHLNVPSPSGSRTTASSPSTSSSTFSSSLPPSPQLLDPAKAGDATGAKTPTSRVDVDEEVEQRIPGSFNFESESAAAADGADAVSPIDVFGVLGGLWRRFHVRS